MGCWYVVELVVNWGVDVFDVEFVLFVLVKGSVGVLIDVEWIELVLVCFVVEVVCLGVFWGIDFDLVVEDVIFFEVGFVVYLNVWVCFVVDFEFEFEYEVVVVFFCDEKGVLLWWFW